MSEIIPLTSFGGIWDGPFHNAPPGALKALQNLRVRPGGWCEMRGGIDQVGPATPSTPFGTGIITGILDSPSPDIVLRVWSQGLAQYKEVGNTGNFSGTLLLQTPQVGDFFALGADFPFSRFQVSVGQACNAGPLTLAYEYSTTDGSPSTFSALTMTQTPDFNTLTTAAAPPNTAIDRLEVGSFAIPAGWVPATLGSEDAGAHGFARKYWIRARVTAVVGGQPLKLGHEPIATDSLGSRELYLVGGNPSTGGSPTGGVVYAYAQDRTTGKWTVVYTPAFIGSGSRSRMVSFRGIPYFVNGVDQVKIYSRNGALSDNIGNPAPTGWGAPGDFTIPGAGSGTWTGGALANLAFRYAVTFGYGPIRQRASNLFATTIGISAGADKNNPGFSPTLFGESGPLFQNPGSASPVVADANRININLGSLTIPSSVDVINLYRTDNLFGSPGNVQENYPMFLLKSIVRSTTGGFPVFPVSVDDQSLAFPFPLKPLDITDNLPPQRCKFIAVHKGCLVLGSNDVYPARIWPSLPFQPDVYDRDTRLIDLTSGTGGRLMGMIEYRDHLVSWTEDNMFGTSDLDTDAFQTFTIGSGLGCVAPDSIVSADGFLFWLSREGVFMWDGDSPPVRISKNLSSTYRRLSFENHGMTRAAYHSRGYEFRTLSADSLVAGVNTHRYEVDTKTWSTVLLANNSNLFPMGRIVAPLGTPQFGKQLPIYTEQKLPSTGTGGVFYFGEQTTQDSGSAIQAIMDAHFGPAGYSAFSMSRLSAYYQATDGWAVPVLSSQSATGIWQTPGQVATLAPQTGTDYSMVDSTNRQSQSGGQDLIFRFAVSSTAGGTVNGQKLLAFYVEGTSTAPKRR